MYDLTGNIFSYECVITVLHHFSSSSTLYVDDDFAYFKKDIDTKFMLACFCGNL